MDILNPHNTVALPADSCNMLYGIAFDGCFFYTTSPRECGIYKFKRDFTMPHLVKTDKPYSGICYDSNENCFWATSDSHMDAIFKLDCDLKEIDKIQVISCQKDCSIIVGLSYNCENDLILIAYRDSIAEVSKETGCARVIQRTCAGSYSAVLSVAPYYAAVLQNGQTQELQIFDNCDREIKSFCVPAYYNIKDILFYPCTDHCRDKYELILLVTKHCRYPKVLFCEISACDMDICSCNYDVCNTRCGEDCDDEQCICDVIESVALVETSLSHILNAEGEKLQKAVELASGVDELLAINRSVTKTIITITQLEHQLFLKLDALNGLREKPIQSYNEMK